MTTLLLALTIWPLPDWSAATPAEVGMNRAELEKARRYALTAGGSGLITRHGRLIMSWGDQDRRYDLKSTTKSIGVTALGLAIADGKMRLEDRAVMHHPSLGVPPDANRQTGWIQRITVEQLATHTAGFEKPGGYTRLAFAPGTKWSYSDGGPNWLAECITRAYKQDVDQLMFRRVFEPLGIDRKDLAWRRNSYRNARIDGVMRREFGSGISANVDAMARIGYLYLRGGQWRGKQIIPRGFVDSVRGTRASVVGLDEVDTKRFGDASDHYGLLWWNNGDGTLKHVPRDAYWSWGLHDSLILVIPSLDIVVSRAGGSWKRGWAGHYDVLRPFFEPIVAAVESRSGRGRKAGTGSPQRPQDINDRDVPSRRSETERPEPPYPASPYFDGIRWAPAATIVRKARGGDNWPVTWGDDGHLYTAYGDGRGFQPYVEKKLSMGLCRIAGEADQFRGSNLRSPTAERTGGGARGPKVSGMLMVDRILYMLVRNTDNTRLAWSRDRGRSWQWSDWRFTTSFGYPTFLNFGKNYAGARDDFVYVYSHDSDSAYRRADRMVLARVAQGRLRDRAAYQFLERVEDGEPVWTSKIQDRGSVFKHPGGCYRSSVSYHAPSARYLWCQTGAGEDTRYHGGLAIYDAPQPWGPWTTVFFTRRWDVGPGETSCLPTKWMSGDGTTIHLVFSGNDCFSVRRGHLLLRKP